MSDTFDNLRNGIPTNVKLTLTSALYGSTEILVDNDVKQIGNFHKIIRKPFSTLGIGPDGKPANTEALIISENMVTSDWVEAKFTNGFSMRCSPTVEVFTKIHGYKQISKLDPDEEIVNMIYHIESGNIACDTTKIESVTDLKKIIPEPVYFICSKTCNIMLPTFNVSGKYLSFITIKH